MVEKDGLTRSNGITQKNSVRDRIFMLSNGLLGGGLASSFSSKGCSNTSVSEVLFFI